MIGELCQACGGNGDKLKVSDAVSRGGQGVGAPVASTPLAVAPLAVGETCGPPDRPNRRRSSSVANSSTDAPCTPAGRGRKRGGAFYDSGELDGMAKFRAVQVTATCKSVTVKGLAPHDLNFLLEAYKGASDDQSVETDGSEIAFDEGLGALHAAEAEEHGLPQA